MLADRLRRFVTIAAQAGAIGVQMGTTEQRSSSMHGTGLRLPTSPTTPTVPTICVIVACFNAGRYLAETLDSVREQTYAAWECVVVDDGSADDTLAVARRFAAVDDRFVVREQANAGVSTARNTGMAAMSPAVSAVAFLDADDVWTTDALQVLVDALDSAPDAVGVYGTAEYIDEHSRPIRPGAHPAVQADRRVLGRFDLVGVPAAAPSTFSSLLVSGTIWPSGVVLHRRVAVERAGRFDPAVARAQDWELYLRMSRLGDFLPVPDQVAWYRRHARNATAASQATVVARHTLGVRWKTWGSASNSQGQRREAARVWRRLTGRWVIWCLLAAVAAARSHDRSGVRDGLAAARYLARRSWKPVEPDDRLAAISVRFVAQRAAGEGSPLP